jgi:hypothetical protein
MTVACGISAWSTQDMFPILKLFGEKENEGIILNPAMSKAAFAPAQLRVYRAGEEYPNVQTTLLLNMKGKRQAFRSGVYAFPTKFEFEVQPFDPKNPATVRAIYEGSRIVPSNMDKPTTVSAIERELRRPISDIVGQIGSGVFYVPICRAFEYSPMAPGAYPELERILGELDSEDQDKLISIVEDIDVAGREGRADHLRPFLGLLAWFQTPEFRDKYKAQSETVDKAIRWLQTFTGNVGLIRTASSTRQNPMGGRRKTRKGKKGKKRMTRRR